MHLGGGTDEQGQARGELTILFFGSCAHLIVYSYRFFSSSECTDFKTHSDRMAATAARACILALPSDSACAHNMFINIMCTSPWSGIREGGGQCQ